MKKIAVMILSAITSLGQTAPAASGDSGHRVACLGDDLTFGAESPARDFTSYPAQLQRMLGGAWTVKNFGVPGASFPPQGPLPDQTQATFKKALNFKPNVVVLLFGATNAVAPGKESAAGHAELVNSLKALQPPPEIYFCLPPSSANDARDEKARGEQEALVRKVVAATGIHTIDLPASDEKETRDANDPAAVVARSVYAALTGKPFPGSLPPIAKSSWQGSAREDFLADGRASLVVIPKEPRAGRPWIWRTEFFGAYPAADLALLAKGYHVAYTNMQNLYGAPAAMEAMDKFHAFMTKTYGLAPKVVLEGFSRGGLYAFNWAARHPDKVASLYVDAPVCDFKSWPGGKGHGSPSPQDWARCRQAYGLTEEQAAHYPLNPVDNLKPLALAKIPIVAVAGDADRTVPVDENILVVEKRYRALGGEIQVILKPGVDHHPHSLTDPTPIVDFLLSHEAAP